MKIGVYICQCGINIAATVDVEQAAEQVGLLPNVEVSRFYKYMCSDPGQELIKKDVMFIEIDNYELIDEIRGKNVIDKVYKKDYDRFIEYLIAIGVREYIKTVRI